MKSRQKLSILFLIPHPFYQDRGSPIADSMILKILSERGEKVDVITYPEGKSIYYNHINIYRTVQIPFIQNISPGFSWKKVVYDFLILIKVIRLLSKKKYHLIHAVEETVFIALLAKAIFKISYVYDMDSSLTQQMIEKYPLLNRLKTILSFLRKLL